MNTNDIKIIREYVLESMGVGDRIDALAALDRLEAQQPDIAKMIEAGDAMDYRLGCGCGPVLCSLCDAANSAWDAAKSAAPAQQQPKRLTDEEYGIIADRMIEEHRKYGDKLRPGHWAEIAARKVVSHLHDFGYLGGLSVEEAMEVVDDEAWKVRDLVEDDPMSGTTDHLTKMLSNVRARLTAKASGKMI